MYWYHAPTKHSYNSVRTNPNQLSQEDQPRTYKNYPNTYEKYKLDLDIKEDNFFIILHVQARGVEGRKDGIYHYEVSTSSLTLLHTMKAQVWKILKEKYKRQNLPTVQADFKRRCLTLCFCFSTIET